MHKELGKIHPPHTQQVSNGAHAVVPAPLTALSAAEQASYPLPGRQRRRARRGGQAPVPPPKRAKRPAFPSPSPRPPPAPGRRIRWGARRPSSGAGSPGRSGIVLRVAPADERPTRAGLAAQPEGLQLAGGEEDCGGRLGHGGWQRFLAGETREWRRIAAASEAACTTHRIAFPSRHSAAGSTVSPYVRRTTKCHMSRCVAAVAVPRDTSTH
jgi:hypothetical protein